jgi:hypothetical protein
MSAKRAAAMARPSEQTSVARSDSASWWQWPSPLGPLPSAFALVAVPARLGRWSRQELAEALQRPLSAQRAPMLGWSLLAERGVAERWGRALNRHPQAIRLGAELVRWYPPALRPLLQSRDPMRFDRLRFCRTCLHRGYHSPLFQLPWWDGCPVHGEPLREGCPTCGSPLPAGFDHDCPGHWFECPDCGLDLADTACLTQLQDRPGADEIARWWTVIADYRRWLRATTQAHWPMLPQLRGEGDCSDFARSAARALLRAVPAAASLQSHLRGDPQGTSSRAWSRTFVERPQPPNVHELGFQSTREMQDRCAHFYGAMPITEESFAVLQHCHRHLRRRVGVNLVGHGSPKAEPGMVAYDWRGRRPYEVQGFRLLTGLIRVERVDDVAYLDFGAVDLLLEPPTRLAHELLQLWTGVDLDSRRKWSQDHVLLLSLPHYIRRARYSNEKPETAPVARSAFRWLYERLIGESWHDVALECFSRAHQDGVVAWGVGSPPYDVRVPQRSIAFPIALKNNAGDEAHPLLEHARADRKRPRGWAAAVLQVDVTDGLETNIALLGRSAPEPFSPPYSSSFTARWLWPEGDEASKTTRRSQATA